MRRIANHWQNGYWASQERKHFLSKTLLDFDSELASLFESL